MRRVELTHDVLCGVVRRQPQRAPRARGARRGRAATGRAARARSRDPPRAGARAHDRHGVRTVLVLVRSPAPCSAFSTCTAPRAAEAAAQSLARQCREARQLPDRGFLHRTRTHRQARHAGQAGAHDGRLLRQPAARTGHQADPDQPRDGADAAGLDPVAGRPSRHRADDVQGCARNLRQTPRRRRSFRACHLWPGFDWIRRRLGCHLHRKRQHAAAASNPPTCCGHLPRLPIHHIEFCSCMATT